MKICTVLTVYGTSKGERKHMGRLRASLSRCVLLEVKEMGPSMASGERNKWEDVNQDGC